MALYLVNPAVEMPLELHVSNELEEALTIQYERIKDRRVRNTFISKLESQLESLLRDAIDWDLKEPTEAQLAYATLVAKQVGVSLPVEARKYRFHTAMFLETFAPSVKKAGAMPGGSDRASKRAAGLSGTEAPATEPEVGFDGRSVPG